MDGKPGRTLIQAFLAEMAAQKNAMIYSAMSY